MYKNIGKRISEICKEKNVTQKDLILNDLGSTPTISNVFHGRQLPTLKFVSGFLDMFPYLDARWLITGKRSTLENNMTSDNQAEYEKKVGDSNKEKIHLEKINSLTEQIELKDQIIANKDEQIALLKRLLGER